MGNYLSAYTGAKIDEVASGGTQHGVAHATLGLAILVAPASGDPAIDSSNIALAITDAGVNGQVTFRKNQTYLIHTEIAVLAGQRIDLNGSTVKRWNGVQATGTYASANVITGIADTSAFIIGCDVTIFNTQTYTPQTFISGDVYGQYLQQDVAATVIAKTANSITISTAMNVGSAWSNGAAPAINDTMLITTLGNIFHAAITDDNVVIKNGVVDGNYSAAYAFAGKSLGRWINAIDIQMAGLAARVDNVTIMNSPCDALVLEGGARSDGVRILNSQGNGFHFGSLGYEGVSVTNFYVNGCSFSAPNTGHADGAFTFSNNVRYLNVSNGVIRNVPNAAAFSPFTTSSYIGLRVSNVYMARCGYALRGTYGQLSMRDAKDQVFTNCVAVNCDLNGANPGVTVGGGVGLSTDPSTGFSNIPLSGNVFRRTSGVFYAAHDFTLKGNIWDNLVKTKALRLNTAAKLYGTNSVPIVGNVTRAGNVLTINFAAGAGATALNALTAGGEGVGDIIFIAGMTGIAPVLQTTSLYGATPAGFYATLTTVSATSLTCSVISSPTLSGAVGVGGSIKVPLMLDPSGIDCYQSGDNIVLSDGTTEQTTTLAAVYEDVDSTELNPLITNGKLGVMTNAAVTVGTAVIPTMRVVPIFPSLLIYNCANVEISEHIIGGLNCVNFDGVNTKNAWITGGMYRGTTGNATTINFIGNIAAGNRSGIRDGVIINGDEGLLANNSYCAQITAPDIDIAGGYFHNLGNTNGRALLVAGADVRVSGGTYKGNGNTTNMIEIVASRCRIKNAEVIMQTANTPGIRIGAGVTGTIVDNVTFTAASASGQKSLYSADATCANTTVKNCTFIAPTFGANYRAIDLSTSATNTIMNNAYEVGTITGTKITLGTTPVCLPATNGGIDRAA